MFQVIQMTRLTDVFEDGKDENTVYGEYSTQSEAYAVLKKQRVLAKTTGVNEWITFKIVSVGIAAIEIV